MSRSLWLLVAACASPTTPPAAPSNTVDANDPNAVHRFTIDRAALPDCTARSVLEHAIIGVSVIRCNDLGADATPAQAADALRCITDAVARKRPFAFVQSVNGIDSGGDFGMLGRMTNGAFVVDELDYDSDPCGGSCPEKGHTVVTECGSYVRNRETDCRPTLRECFTCDHKHDVAECVQGSGVSR
jgi:hypothetical protein